MSAPLSPALLLQAHGLHARKALSQNFLSDPHLPSQIAEAGGAGPGELVFEIGAGLGTLTRAIADRGAAVRAIEYDPALLEIAQRELATYESVEVTLGDVREQSWSALAEQLGRPPLVYGNLPYALSTEILLGLLDEAPYWRRACLLVQKEFAERVSAPPGDRRCGAISAYTSLLTWATLLFEVPPSAFTPPPKVDSALLILERRPAPAVEVGDLRTFRTVVRALFNQRRKMARRALRSITQEPEQLLNAAGLAPETRGERFTLEELGRLSLAYAALRQGEAGSESSSRGEEKGTGE